MAAKKGLSKGLGAIYGKDIDSLLDEISNEENISKGDAIKIKVKDIRPNPYQPRKTFNAEGLQELADSIKEHGVFNPILVRKSIQGYELIAGERRLRASKLAKINEIPAIILPFDDKAMMEVSLLENIQREDLSPIEEAIAYEQLIKKLKYTQEQLAKRVSKSRTYITNTLRLLKLPAKVQNMLTKGELTYGHARALINIEDEEKIINLATQAVKQKLTVRDMERLAAKDKTTTVKKAKKEDPYLRSVRRAIEDRLSTNVEVTSSKIIIHYKDVDTLNNILEELDCLEK